VRYPTSYVQEGVVVASGLAPSTDLIPAAWEIRGDFDPPEILRALQLVVARHESLRTGIVQVDASFEQRVVLTRAMRNPITVVDAPEAPRAGELMGRLLGQRFDLSRPPLWRGYLIRRARGRHALVVVFARVLADTASLAVLGRDLARALAGIAPSPLQLGPLAERERGLSPTPSQVKWWKERYVHRTPMPATWRGTAGYRVDPVPLLAPATVTLLRDRAEQLEVNAGTILGAVTALATSAVLDCDRPMLGFATARRSDGTQDVFGPLQDRLPVLGGAASHVAFDAYVHALFRRLHAAHVHRLPGGVLAGIAGAMPYDVALDVAPLDPPAPERIGDAGSVIARPVPLLGRPTLYRATSAAPVLAVRLRPGEGGSLAGDVLAVAKVHRGPSTGRLAAAIPALVERVVRQPDIPIGQLRN
jgi:hypothetical protein